MARHSPWPRRGETDRRPLQRAAGAYVVLVDGVAALYLERGGPRCRRSPPVDDPAVAVTAARALRALVDDGRIRELVLAQGRWRGRGGLTVPAVLFEAGFVAGYRGLVLRPQRSHA